MENNDEIKIAKIKDLNKINWKYFTTDFEVSLHESFKNPFFIRNFLIFFM